MPLTESSMLLSDWFWAKFPESEGIICNKIAANFTGTKAVNPSDNDKLRADIQIQKDILEFINNGGQCT